MSAPDPAAPRGDAPSCGAPPRERARPAPRPRAADRSLPASRFGSRWREHVTGLSGLAAAAGAWLIVSPWLLNYHPADPTWDDVDLDDVASLGIDTGRAGFSCGRLSVTTDGPATVRLLGLRPRRALRFSAGSATVRIPCGGAGNARP